MPNPFTGTSASDAINIASIQGTSAPKNNVTYTVDGAAGTDTFTLTSSGGAYNNFPKANFTISAADAAGVTTISGASTGGTFYTFKLQNVETVVFKDATVQLSTLPAGPDTAAPVYASATANASSVVMTYTDASNLDATNAPPANAFTVSNHAVTGATVNATTKTVTLALATPVTTGESLAITYKDPTTGNDTLALQDIAGNDVATSTNTITAGLDTTAPTITSYSPADGSAGFAVSSNIDITFSEAIKAGTGTILLHSGSATSTTLAPITTSISGQTLTIDPTDNLAYNTHYYVTFSSVSSGSGSEDDGEHDSEDNDHGGSSATATTTAYAITDIAGNNFIGTNVYDFTTGGDPFAPVTNAVTDAGPVLVGVGGLGILAWAFLL